MSKTSIKQLTPELIRSWALLEEKKASIFKVRILKEVVCLKSGERVSLSSCNDCPHNFGYISTRSIYCIPDMRRQPSKKVTRGS